MSRIKTKFIAPIIFIFILCGLTSIITLIYTVSHEQTIRIEQLLAKQQQFYDFVVANKLRSMEALSSIIVTNSSIINALEQKDTSKLTQMAMPIFRTLENAHITHFYFISVDKKVILRLHNQGLSGDTIDRFGLNKAASVGVPVGGAEAGINGRMTLRYTIPIFKQDKLIGFIELGEDLDTIFTEISTILDCDITLLVHKINVDMDAFEKSSKQNQLKYRHVQDYIVAASNMSNLEDIQDYISDCNSSKMANSLFFYQNYACTPFYDVSGAKIGKIVFTFHDYNKIYFELFKTILIATLILLPLIGLIFYFYYKYIAKVSRIIEKQHCALQRTSITDHLTKLYNRRYFDGVAVTKLFTAKRFNQLAVFILADIDKFKLYNDTYGHQKGDEALVQVAAALKHSCKRSTDIVSRLGGEEFAIFAMFQDEIQLKKHIETILKAVEGTQILHENNTPYGIVTISIGYAICKPDQYVTITELYEAADKALYKSKANGRNKAYCQEVI
ncbi:MAG: hypothetical protein RL154_1325 [Pseudomonadota bacterium]|jgi:diguanylate cyclase (GGDEF)-like protein